jgi:antitoxin component YwqK of YwqJK toxin-antitoxin module
MTKILMIAIAAFLFSKARAQEIDDVSGKTYYFYDEQTKKKVKEIYHHKQVVKIIPDKNNYGSYRDTMLYMKNGPYTRYYETGELECSGYFTDERKDSVWKYYTIKGDILRIERWANGKLVQ